MSDLDRLINERWDRRQSIYAAETYVGPLAEERVLRARPTVGEWQDMGVLSSDGSTEMRSRRLLAVNKQRDGYYLVFGHPEVLARHRRAL